MSTSLQASEGRLEAVLKSSHETGVLERHITEVLESAAADRDTVGPRSGLTTAVARTDDEGKWIELAEGVALPLVPFMLKLLGELGGDASARFIGERVLGAAGDQARALTRAGITALRNIGGVTAAVLLAKLAGDDRIQDDLRRRAFVAVEEIASFGSERVAEGGVISIDKEAVAFWDQHRADFPLWQPARIIEELDRIRGAEWEQRAAAVRGVVLTQTRAELEAELRRQFDPVLFVSYGVLAASNRPSRWYDAARCEVFVSRFGELEVNPHWMSGRLPEARELACAVTSRQFRTWQAPMPMPHLSDAHRTIFRCRQLAAHAAPAGDAEVFAFGERNALALLLGLAAGHRDPSGPILLTGTASARRDFVTSAFAERRAGRPIREFTCSRWPRSLLDRFLGEIAGFERATLFLDEIEALTPAAQARLLEVMKTREREAPLVLAGTSRTPEELESSRLLEPSLLDWLSSGVTLYVSQAA
jgi:hypothetical protein